MPDLNLIAEEMLRLQDEASLAPSITSFHPDFSIDDAYRVSAMVLARRKAEGWQPLGRKIGFTNRTIYEEYGVYQPIFGYMYDRTISYLNPDEGIHVVSLQGLSQPRMEPEIAFRLRAPVPLTRDPVTLLGSIEWIAHGVELVQCHFPDWRFAVADTIADGGLHGLYVVGKPMAVPEQAEERAILASQLEHFTAGLFREDVLIAEGGGEVVLGSPINALAHLVEVLGTLRQHPSLAAGELVTTGTLTAAMPVSSGEIWSTRLEGLPLEGLRLSFR